MPQIHSSNTQSSEICLMIKVYPDGVFTQHVDNLDIGVCEWVWGFMLLILVLLYIIEAHA